MKGGRGASVFDRGPSAGQGREVRGICHLGELREVLVFGALGEVVAGAET